MLNVNELCLNENHHASRTIDSDLLNTVASIIDVNVFRYSQAFDEYQIDLTVTLCAQASN
jgi:hypothetical protein